MLGDALLPWTGAFARLIGAGSAPSTVHIGFGQLAQAVVSCVLACIPIGISLWALLDAVHRPQWAWALTDRRQVVWLIAILFGMFTLFGGLILSLWYLLRIRPEIAAIERGDLGGTLGTGAG